MKGRRTKVAQLAFCSTSLVLLLISLCWAWMGGEAQRDPVEPSANTSLKHSSSVIAITSDGNTLLAVNPDSNSLTFVDTASQAVILELPVGMDPRSVAISPDNRMGVIANQGSDTLSVVDIPLQVVTATLEVGDRPMGVAVSPDGRFIAVAESGDDQVRLLNAANFETIFLIPVADRPYGLAFAPDNRLLVSHLLMGGITVIFVEPYYAYLPFVITNRSLAEAVSEHHPSTHRTSADFPVRSIPTWPNIAPAPSVIVNAVGTRAYLPQTMANGLGYNTGFDTTVFPKVSVLNLETNTHQTAEHISLPETDRPVGLPWDAALAKNDSELWVVNSASNDVSVINISNPTHPTRRANVPVGDNPRGIVMAPDGSRAYVNNTLTGTISVIDASTYTVTQFIPITHIPLPPALLNGKRLYFSSARPDLARARWISCNTCHIEGEADGRTWLIKFLGEKPGSETLASLTLASEASIIRRNTTSLLGMIETYPLRWSAEWNESADSEFSIRFEQFGLGLIDGDMHPTLGDPNQGRSYDLDCLALFIDSLTVPVRAHTLTETESRGKTIFESSQTQCAVCHPAPLYTDLQVHNVGTASGAGEWFGPLIDTPTLRFLYDSAPYLHDGSAATLSEVLTIKNAYDQHGTTSHLTKQHLEDLEAFLLALPYEENP